MYIECPKCGNDNDVSDNLPDNACDSNEVQCDNCDHQFLIGWTAEVELR